MGYSYNLANNIDATGTITWNSGKGFRRIDAYYTGIFDGQNYTIDGLYMNNSANLGYGLFFAIGEPTGTIKNLGLTK